VNRLSTIHSILRGGGGDGPSLYRRKYHMIREFHCVTFSGKKRGEMVTKNGNIKMVTSNGNMQKW